MPGYVLGWYGAIPVQSVLAREKEGYADMLIALSGQGWISAFSMKSNSVDTYDA